MWCSTQRRVCARVCSSFSSFPSLLATHTPATRRLLGSANTPRHLRPRSWKSSATRWALAGAGLYWYSTSPIFQHDPPHVPPVNEAAASNDNALPTLASLAPSARPSSDTATSKSSLSSSAGAPSSPDSGSSESPSSPGAPTSPDALEDEASSQGAFNEETGEINWDCPCLGGMAHGPCGEEFRAAFSCFVYSKEEPKGMDCIDRFKGMQDCFRRHPDVYGEELGDDDEDDAAVDSSHGETVAPSDDKSGSAQVQSRQTAKVSDDDTLNQKASHSSASLDGASPDSAGGSKASSNSRTSSAKPSRKASSTKTSAEVEAADEGAAVAAEAPEDMPAMAAVSETLEKDEQQREHEREQQTRSQKASKDKESKPQDQPRRTSRPPADPHVSALG